jgi:hypothetical protein
MELREKVSGERSALERLLGSIPGYRGYKEKEMRREADKLLRVHLAQRFEEQRGRITRVQSRLAEAGDLKTVVALERAMMRLQLLIDRLKTAAYGHSGFFDATRVQEKELDALYEYDQGLAGGVDKIAQMTDRLAQATDAGVITAAGDELVAILENLNDTFSRRQDVILGLGEASAPAKT